MKQIRCSNLPLLFACGGAILGTILVPVDKASTMATLGTAAHEALRRHLGGETVDLDAIATLYGTDRKELGVLFHLALRMWAELAPPDLSSVAFEADLPELVFPVGDEAWALTGTPDIAWVSGTGYVVDWKTGRKDSDYREQVLGYSALLLRSHPEIDEVYARVAWIRDQEIETHRLARRDLPAWQARLTKALDWQGVFRPGAHCNYCKRKLECTAKKETDAALVESFTKGIVPRGAEFDSLPATTAIRLYRQAKQVWELADAVRNAMRDRLMREGELISPDGALRMTEYQTREVDTLKAWPVLSHRLSDTELARCVTVSIGEVETVCAERAGKGHGAAAKREIVQALDEVRAIERVTKKKIVERRE